MKFTTAFTILAAVALTNARVLRRAPQANSQTFTGALGGVEATPILDSGNEDRPFEVNGATFVNLGAALQRSCDQQFNGCANLANSGQGDFDTSECQAQKDLRMLCQRSNDPECMKFDDPPNNFHCCYLNPKMK
ncbi:hypothetical protein BU24DRAFT_445992 [Aaosphaeria arxii CBS 175.79]|uniref:Uncharacterized protein n=1 Tax=Aaosphaeria arxii CBS 175.79 TaxID=1450172 RepID=A0A6A5Y6D3_9PLEO|nr:uncharacterized protein BU24DRAFT_445992 [Aaosphaeria arxii CBS 175.79]KAF2020849.1 hypothetical protein BU24DRAFT_445992 [Aaosphaeria arxii CBS 175.79]